MNAVIGGIKKGRKFDQVVEGARQVFLRDGFEGASVDDIARAAHVSKATLYSYFPDKRQLFMQVVRQQCVTQTEAALDAIDFGAPAPDVLKTAGLHLAAYFLSDFGQRVYRICVAESDRFPGLGREYYETGPALVRDQLSRFLTTAHERGELTIPDICLAADQFAELCKADLFSRRVFGVKSGFSKAEVERVISSAVTMFMARYQTRA